MKGMEEKLECWNVGIRESVVDCNDYISYIKMVDIIYQVLKWCISLIVNVIVAEHAHIARALNINRYTLRKYPNLGVKSMDHSPLGC